MPNFFFWSDGHLINAAKKDENLASAVRQRETNVLSLIQRTEGCCLP